ncbi:hypothetical protein [Floridanema aerugineum]|jgi:hypothetical protein|uniref:Uncharacterized protein n=1 Tax=Floridaenema aerugineum BLCC-F46 TaxID=3153654 RepID=A0ABV4WZ45_9CYAN
MDLEAIRHTSWREQIPLSPKSVLRLVERPLNRWIFENYPDFNLLAGKRLVIDLGQNNLLSVLEG